MGKTLSFKFEYVDENHDIIFLNNCINEVIPIQDSKENRFYEKRNYSHDGKMILEPLTKKQGILKIRPKQVWDFQSEIEKNTKKTNNISFYNRLNIRLIMHLGNESIESKPFKYIHIFYF